MGYTVTALGKKMTYVSTFSISSSLMYACMHDESWGRHWSNRLCRTLSCPRGELVRRGGGVGGEGEGVGEGVREWKKIGASMRVCGGRRQEM
jgi:hypothetical protein